MTKDRAGGRFERRPGLLSSGEAKAENQPRRKGIVPVFRSPSRWRMSNFTLTEPGENDMVELPLPRASLLATVKVRVRPLFLPATVLPRLLDSQRPVLSLKRIVPEKL